MTNIPAKIYDQDTNSKKITKTQSKKIQKIKNYKRALTGLLLMYGAAALILISVFDFDLTIIFNSLKRYYLAVIGSLVLIYAISKYLIPSFRSGSSQGKFQDVDIQYQRYTNRIFQLETKNAELQAMIQYIGKGGQKSEETSKEIDVNEINFNAYFFEMKSVIEEKARVADEKASILLDKGTNYARLGIIFFIISIIAWQLMAWAMGGIHTQLIYGIASCSFLFIFIEFLSAWFLKQYRHFVDTSTYLIKVKSILDKYMLVVLYSQNSPDKIRDDVVTHLSEDINWPELSKFSREEVSFAKEAIESATNLVKSIRSNQKDNQT